MGQLISWAIQPKEVKVIYVEDPDRKIRKKEGKRKRMYEFRWPILYSEFVAAIKRLFPDHPVKKGRFVFEDGGEYEVCVFDEAMYDGLVPKHHQAAPKVDLYYVILKKWS